MDPPVHAGEQGAVTGLRRIPTPGRTHLTILSTLTLLAAGLLWLGAGPAEGQTAAKVIEYRTFFGLDPRTTVWIIAELHLLFGAFVLGVPIFAVLAEYIGYRTGEARYDRLARDFTKLLSAAFATTAALGGLLAFTLFSLYPKFMGYLTGVFHETFYVYAGLFFLETAALYAYLYTWDRLQDRKRLHIALGVALNLAGTAILVIANSWAAYMMSPVGVDKVSGEFAGSAWVAVWNPLSVPLLLHRFLGNILFGGLVTGLYAAVKFLGAAAEEERAHYDWMGYVGNLVAVSTLIFMPFAGYYLGREVYSTSPVMGNNMMGGAFSWTFIIQATLVGFLFILANYYLWLGMERIPGAERYQRYIKYINLPILVGFAVWLTPHNLPLSGEEQQLIGGQYHPTLKWLGLMPAKNAVINLVILGTFVSYLLYRRSNKKGPVPFSAQGRAGAAVLLAAGGVALAFLVYYAVHVLSLDPKLLDLPADRVRLFRPVGFLLLLQGAAVAASLALTFRDRGQLGQGVLVGVTFLNAVLILGVYGFVVMAQANPFLREIAVAQWLSLLSCLLTVLAIDVLLYRKAESVGPLRWGRMPVRSQYVLIALTVLATINMAVMGFIRSGLRENWHIYGVLEDTSPWAFTPTDAYAATVIALTVFAFLGMMALLFWLMEQGEKKTLAPKPESSLSGGQGESLR